MTRAPGARELIAGLATLPDRSVGGVRRWLRERSRELADEPPAAIRRRALAMIAAPDPTARWAAYELVHAHRATRESLTAAHVRALGKGMASWQDTDVFACYVSGPAWQARRLPDAEVMRWARSRDVWWRRAALASTVSLNVRGRGGTGDVPRTLRVVEVLVDDREPMVVKAVSWALRSLVPHDAAAVRRFVAAHPGLPALARREVAHKLATGLKAKRRGAERRRG